MTANRVGGSRLPALVPAAGEGRRLGGGKLALPVHGGISVIGRVVQALKQGGCDPVLVVLPPADRPDAPTLEAMAVEAGAECLDCPAATSDMRATVELGLEVLFQRVPDCIGLLLAPGDSVGMTPSLVERVRERFQADPTRLVVPMSDGRRGHPIALPRDLADQIASLPEGLGIKALRDQNLDRVEWLPISDTDALDDLDTPDDYARWSPRQHAEQPEP